MRSPPTTADDCDDIFGPPRTYPAGYCPPARSRLSMISAKYKQKEERRKVLKISMGKLKKIEDPESSLCRSVLINNTVKRLQRETRDEKLQTQQLNYPRCCADGDGYLGRGEFAKGEVKEEVGGERVVEMVIENDFDTKLAEEISTVSAKDIDVLGNLVEDIVNPQTAKENQPKPPRKRSFDEIDDCDVQDVLSQFYMPPTPRMLTAIDDDEDINVVDEEPLAKRLKETPQEETKPKPAEKPLTNFSINSFINNNNLPKFGGESERFSSAEGDGASFCDFSRFGVAQGDSSDSSFSCGHASMFGDLQSNVYHNLIASLET